jgi:hypothetical protein
MVAGLATGQEPVIGPPHEPLTMTDTVTLADAVPAADTAAAAHAMAFPPRFAAALATAASSEDGRDLCLRLGTGLLHLGIEVWHRAPRVGQHEGGVDIFAGGVHPILH